MSDDERAETERLAQLDTAYWAGYRAGCRAMQHKLDTRGTGGETAGFWYRNGWRDALNQAVLTFELVPSFVVNRAQILHELHALLSTNERPRPSSQL